MTFNKQVMKDEEVVTPNTNEELIKYIDNLLDGEHDYGTCVYAMSMASTATFNYIAHKLGVTAFQASCADMDILRRTRRIKGGFIILKGEDLLYPQYDLQQKLDEFISNQRNWLRDEAKKKLADPSNNQAHPDVKAHWERLAGE